MPIPEITEDIINGLASGASLTKGYSYFHSGAVVKLWIEDGVYKAHVEGSELYTVTISGKKGSIQTDCTCPYDWGGVCKHVVAEHIGKLSLSIQNKKPYLDYLLQVYNGFLNKEVFRVVFPKAVNTSEEADYVLGKHNVNLIPPIILDLLIVKGEPEAVFSFGEKHYKEYPEMASPLSTFYLKRNLRDKAIATAEKALEVIQGKRRDFRLGFYLPDQQKELREFLDRCYRTESDYPKIVENLIMLIYQERDIAYYKKMKKAIKTEVEMNAIIERLEKLLDSDYDLLFKIYSLEDDYESMLKLAKKSILFDVFNLVVKKIRDRYPEECFDLYKKKINAFLEDVKNRDAYRQAAYWLKLMKEIPGTQDKFRKYIEHLREKYRRRPAFIDEIKGV